MDEKNVHLSLQDYITEDNREALVKKIYTVTSSLGSLRQGKYYSLDHKCKKVFHN